MAGYTYTRCASAGRRVAKYSTKEEIIAAAKRIKIKSAHDYRKRYREDPKLPRYAKLIYESWWDG